MRLAAADDQRAVRGKPVEKARLVAGVERHLVRGIAVIGAQFRHRRPEALGILFGEQQRHAEQPRGIDQPAGVGDRRTPVLDRRHQPRLEIDEEQGGTIAVDGRHGCLHLILAYDDGFLSLVAADACAGIVAAMAIALTPVPQAAIPAGEDAMASLLDAGPCRQGPPAPALRGRPG
jgi:hypothetical protein